MPRAPSRGCASYPCPNLARPGHIYCTEHERQRQQETDSIRAQSSRRGYGRDWPARRARQLMEYPLCAACGLAAQLVDHIVPVARGGTSHSENLQSLCARCHRAKTIRQTNMRVGK